MLGDHNASPRPDFKPRSFDGQTIATWIRPSSGHMPRLAILGGGGQQIGIVDFGDDEYEMHWVFDADEHKKSEYRTIYNLAAHGRQIAFTSGRLLSIYEGGGRNGRDDLVLVGEQDPCRHVLSTVSPRGWWVHGAEDGYPNWFLDVYVKKEQLKRYSFTVGGNLPIGGAGSRFIWSPTGSYAIIKEQLVGNWESMRCLVTTKQLHDFRFDLVYGYGGYIFRLPPPCTSIFGGAAWHPVDDVLAFPTYRETSGPAVDWHIAICDAATRQLLHALPVEEPRQLECMAWGAGGRYLASGGEGRCVFLWDLLTGAASKLLGHKGTIGFLEFSPDGQRLLSSGAGECCIWNPATGERVADWSGGIDRYEVRESPWSPDASMVAGGHIVHRLVI